MATRKPARKKSISAKRPSKARFRLVSSDFRHNGNLAMAQVFNSFGCSGRNISPQLAWSGAPEGTKSFALLVHDPDAPTGGAGWWHWLVINIPARVTGLKKNAGKASGTGLPAGAVHVDTDFGGPGWGGPCPPAGDKAHRYHFTLYALKTDRLDVSGASASLAGYMVNAHALAKTILTGKLARKK